MLDLDRAGADDVESPRLSREELFEVLSNTRRRYAIRYLLQRGEPVDLRSLSEQVAAWETGKPTGEVTSSERHRVYNALQQTHLPKMTRAGVVTVDRGQVSPADGLQDCRLYMEVVARNDIPWSLYYVGLGTLGLVTAAALAADIAPFRSLSAVAVLGLFASLVIVSGLVNYYQQRSMQIDIDGDPSE